MLANKALSAAPSAVPAYIEDVFSAYLYTGTGATRTITNNIDLSTKGGLVWIKQRDTAENHKLVDTVRGATLSLESNTTIASATETAGLTGFTSSGFSLGADAEFNYNTGTYVSWTFAQQAKFFDVVTYTGNGSNRTISHNLGSTPGCIMVKRTDDVNEWVVYHRSLGATKALTLNTTDAAYTNNTRWNDTEPTSTNFTVGTNAGVNASGGTYVAYLFAHDAGGFGLAGTDSVIKCGSYTGNGSSTGPSINLGWEPEFIIVKESSNTNNWYMFDTMRGWVTGSNDAALYCDSSTSEAAINIGNVSATGFDITSTSVAFNRNGGTYIYIAIRRGPMKTPTTGTSIFTPTAFSGNDTSGTRSAGLDGFDLLISKRTASSSLDWVWLDKLRGLKGDRWLASNSTMYEKAEGGAGDQINTINGQYTQDGINITKTSNYSYLDAGSSDYIWYALKRAPGAFDMVAYTGTGSARTVTHNLGAVPELIILKCRVATYEWVVYNKDVGNTKVMNLQSTGGSYTWSAFNDTTPTSSVFSLGDKIDANQNTYNYIAYLFATLPGVTKVGTYTGNGSSQTINCGFTAGARFVMIKRTDTSGAWYVYDTARGIVSGNDSQLRFNSDGVAATGFDAVDPDNSGFIVNNDATNFPINVSSATYIYLAIA